MAVSVSPFPFAVCTTMTYECNRCGNDYGTEGGMKRHKAWSHYNPWDDIRVLKTLYYEEGYSMKSIAEELGCSSATVERRMEEFDLERRKSFDDPTYPPHHTFNPYDEDIVGAEYEKIYSRIDGDLYQFPIHRLMGVAYGIIEPHEFFDSSVIIHHRTEHGLDNRPGNLERMERGDHVKHHVPWGHSPIIG